jgi:hypothetical protein
MKVRIVLISDTARQILQALLPRNSQSIAELVLAGERSGMNSVARTLLVKYKEPVAVILETHTSDAATVGEKLRSMEYLLEIVAGGTPFKVVPCVPEIEVIFFEAPNLLKSMFPKFDLATYSMFCKTQPREVLNLLLNQGGGPTTLEQFLASLTEKDLEKLRTKGPAQELIQFISEATSALEKQGIKS